MKNYFNSSKKILLNNLPFNTKKYGTLYEMNIIFNKTNYTKKIPYGTIVKKIEYY